MQVIRKTVKSIPFYACDGFGPGVAHGFSTRIGGVSPAPWDSLNLGACRGDDPANLRENFRRFCDAIGADPNALVKNQQMHSKRVRPVTRADVMPTPETPGEVEADGMITNQPGVALTIFSGDCLPVFLYDPVRRVIAACHAGWRGTAQGIAAQAARQMQEDYGCAPQDILAAIGPGIGPCCFETHADVPTALTAQLGQGAAPYIIPKVERPGKFAVDLKGIIRWELLEGGLREENISTLPLCTACHPELYWSHRKMGEQRGNHAAMIQLN